MRVRGAGSIRLWNMRDEATVADMHVGGDEDEGEGGESAQQRSAMADVAKLPDAGGGGVRRDADGEVGRGEEQPFALLVGHTGPAYAACFSPDPDATFLLSASEVRAVATSAHVCA